VILCAPLLFSTRGFVLFDDDAQRTNSYVQNVLKEERTRNSLLLPQNSKTLNIYALKLLHEKL
jgi:hypothetical protein